MYGSIDSAAHALTRKLRKYKERRTAGWHGGTHMGEDLRKALDALDEAEELDGMLAEEEEMYQDPDKANVVKVKSFDLDKPISLDEAIFALDYVDHDFYVFRNDMTNKVSVVYKRHTGGSWFD